MTVVAALLAGALAAAPAGRLSDLAPVDCDVCVVGAGAAGIAAALQAGEAGVRTVLVEQGGQVGGNMTSGGVNFPGLFHAWGRQVIDGCSYRLLTNCVFTAGQKLPDFSMPEDLAKWRHPRHQISFDIPLYIALAEEALEKAGVRILYYTAPQAVRHGADGWTVETVAIGAARTVRARQLVDATGNGSVAALAGARRMRDETISPGSLYYRVRVPKDIQVDAKALQAAFNREVAEGRMLRSDLRYDMASFLKTGGGVNNYVPDADNSTAELRADANRRGRASMLRMYRFLRSQPGLGGVRLEEMSPEVGVRETYRVEGDYVITHDDYVSGRVFDDAVSYAFYPIDLHDVKGGVKPKKLAPGVVATVPLAALRVKGVPDLWVAGRCLSSDRLANSALRVEATCMATGQAAGEAAALAARKGIRAGEVDVNELKGLLRKSGAIVP